MNATTITRDRAGRSALHNGMRTGAAAIVGFVPFGLVVGAELSSSRIRRPLAWSTNSLIYGGTAQLLLVRLLEAGSSLAAAVLAVIAINGPLLAAGRDLAPDLAVERRHMRIAAALLLVVPAWSVARATQHGDVPADSGPATTLASPWPCSSAGRSPPRPAWCSPGDALPPLSHLAAPAAITALLALALTTRVAIAAAAVSALVTLVTAPAADRTRDPRRPRRRHRRRKSPIMSSLALVTAVTGGHRRTAPATDSASTTVTAGIVGALVAASLSALVASSLTGPAPALSLASRDGRTPRRWRRGASTTVAHPCRRRRARRRLGNIPHHLATRTLTKESSMQITGLGFVGTRTSRRAEIGRLPPRRPAARRIGAPRRRRRPVPTSGWLILRRGGRDRARADGGFTVADLDNAVMELDTPGSRQTTRSHPTDDSGTCTSEPPTATSTNSSNRQPWNDP